MPAGRGVVRAPPTIAIEIVSASPIDARRDRVEKVQDYAAIGVTWYWLVDPQVRTFEILERTADGRYAIALSATSGLLDQVPACDGLCIDLDALWADVDRALAEVGD